MYLLILVATSILHSINVFTSHYVSINSNSSVVCCAIFPHLHPTMYLLILKGVSCSPLSYLYLHPTMYLLILGYPENSAGVILFTSHYVSINSFPDMLCKGCHIDLHPTMYLLIPVIIKASLFLNSEALFCLPFKSANRLLILYALNMPEA